MTLRDVGVEVPDVSLLYGESPSSTIKWSFLYLDFNNLECSVVDCIGENISPDIFFRLTTAIVTTDVTFCECL